MALFKTPPFRQSGIAQVIGLSAYVVGEKRVLRSALRKVCINPGQASYRDS
jgi:hypothetical protein